MDFSTRELLEIRAFTEKSAHYTCFFQESGCFLFFSTQQLYITV
jgi:hypothetical protein